MIFTLNPIHRMSQAFLIQHLYIHYDLLLQQHFCLRYLPFYAHYYHLPNMNTCLSLIQPVAVLTKPLKHVIVLLSFTFFLFKNF